MIQEDQDTGSPGDRTSSAARSGVLYTAVCCAIAFAVFAPIIYHMVLHWKASDTYSHGFLVGPLAVYFAWEKRRELGQAIIKPSWLGLIPLALGALALTIGRLGVELMAMRTAFVLTICGLHLLLLGRQVTRILAFPLLFLFMMVPLPQSLVNVVAFPLQLIAAKFAVGSLHLLHVPVLLEGNILHLAGGTQLFVHEACSGLRSLMALGTLGVVFAYFFRKNWIERAIIVLSAIPIAILVNAFRVAVTGFLSHQYGPSFAEGAIHETEGFVTFGLAMGLLMFEAWLLSQFWPGRWRKPSKTAAV